MSIDFCRGCEVIVEGQVKEVVEYPYGPTIRKCPYCDDEVTSLREDEDREFFGRA
jgi:hypothetical protein